MRFNLNMDKTTHFIIYIIYRHSRAETLSIDQGREKNKGNFKVEGRHVIRTLGKRRGFPEAATSHFIMAICNDVLKNYIDLTWLNYANQKTKCL